VSMRDLGLFSFFCSLSLSVSVSISQFLLSPPLSMTCLLLIFTYFQCLDNAVPAKWLNMPQWMGKDVVKQGTLYSGVVTHFDNARVTVALSPFVSSHLSYVDISSDLELIKKLKANCFIGLRLVVAAMTVKTSPHRTLSLSRVAIESVATGQFYADLSTLVSTDSIPNAQTTPPPLKVGAIVTGLVNFFGCSKISRPPAIQIQLPFHQFGRLCVTEIEESGSWTSDFSPLFLDTERDNNLVATQEFGGLKHGDLVSFRVLSVPDHGSVELSCRPSRLVSLFFTFRVILHRSLNLVVSDGNQEEGLNQT
jgi:hypothetical protein